VFNALIGSAEARKMVQRTASGADSVLTYEAQLIITRWSKTVVRQ